MNHYWRTVLVEEISEHPGQWIRLMGWKCLYLLNDWEQYNNLSYQYQKQRFPLLRFNPLGWGILFLAGMMALFVYGRNAVKVELLGLLFAGFCYTVGVLLFYVSARFRLPLVSLLCVCCGGWVCASGNSLIKRWLFVLSVGSSGAVLCYPNWFNARDRSSFIQDQFLVAKAASNIGSDLEALELSRSIRAKDMERMDVRQLEVISLFNLWLKTEDRVSKDRYWKELGEVLPLQTNNPSILFISGLMEWRSDRKNDAIKYWKKSVNLYGSAKNLSADALSIVDGNVAKRDGPLKDLSSLKALLEE